MAEDTVASLADAWIETNCREPCGAVRAVASLADAWIETAVNRAVVAVLAGRVPRGRVD